MSRNRVIMGLLVTSSFVSLSFGLFTPNTYSDKEEANLYFQKGSELYNLYQYQASTDFFLKSLSANPKHHGARKMLGQAYYFSGDINTAIQEWSTLLRQGGRDPALRLHIQNLSTLDRKRELSDDFIFFDKLNSKIGFRYQFPTFVLVLPNQNILILAKDKMDNGVLLEVSPDGEFIHNMRRISGRLDLPMATAVSKEGEVWVTDYSSDSIHRIEWSQLKKQIPLLFSMSSLGTTGSGEMQFRGPAGICHYRGFYFVVDSGNHRIQKITENGKFNLMFNETEENDYLEKPFGIACRKNGTIYVSEVDRGRISVFDEYGNFEKYIGESFLKKPRHIQLDNEQDYLVIADEYEGVFILDIDKGHFKKINKYEQGEQTTGSFVKAYSAVLDKNQNLFVADYSAHSILHFLPQEHLFKNIELWVERIDNKQFPTVALWISVKDHANNYITGLQRTNFQIIENGAKIHNLQVGYDNQFNNQVAMTILLSRNKKMQAYHPDSPLWVLDFIIQQLRKNDQIKLISYDKKYRDETSWINSRLRLRQGIREALPINENLDNVATSIVEKALYYSASELLPMKGKKALVWLHEGEFESSEFSPIGFQKISNYLKLNHIRLYVISFENPGVVYVQKKKELLKQLAQNTGGKYYHAYSSKLQEISSTIRAQNKENMVVYYNSETSSKWKNQYMDIKMMVNFQGRAGAETSGYFIP